LATGAEAANLCGNRAGESSEILVPCLLNATSAGTARWGRGVRATRINTSAAEAARE